MDKLWIHNETSFVYEVVGTYIASNGSQMVELKRVHDGAGPLHLLKEALNESYKPAHAVSDATEETTVGILIDPEYTMDELILTASVREELELGVTQAANAKAIAQAFGNKSFKKTTLNFHGAPGTGKTMSAHAVASQLGKKVYIADYAQLKSKWHGETAKHIKKMFQEATQNDAVLFLDEADTLLSKRVESGSEMGEALNLEKNVFMQELDRFEGIVIMATNLFENFDEALNRRIARHIHFSLPDATARAAILSNLLGSKHSVDILDIAVMANHLGGGDLKKAVENAQVKAFMANSRQPKVSHAMLNDEIQKVIASKMAQGLISKARKIGL